MKQVKMGLCMIDEENNLLTFKSLKSNWTLDIERDLKAKLHNNVMDEIAAILTESVKLEVTEEVVREMITEIQKGIYT